MYAYLMAREFSAVATVRTHLLESDVKVRRYWNKKTWNKKSTSRQYERCFLFTAFPAL